jgi:hypothetical protein
VKIHCVAIPQLAIPTWRALRRAALEVHTKWYVYLELFGRSPERLDLLDTCANLFFVFADRAMLLDMQMALSRVSDPAETGGKKKTNLTFQRLVHELEASAAPCNLLTSLKSQSAQFTASCGKLRDRRNKYFAHSDYESVTQHPTKMFDGPYRNEIETALGALRKFLDSVAEHYGEQPLIYDALIRIDTGNDLVLWLKRGLRYKELQDEDKLGADDLKQSRWCDA